MAAQKFDITFAKKQMNYFHNVLNSGKNDPLRNLLEILKDTDIRDFAPLRISNKIHKAMTESSATKIIMIDDVISEIQDAIIFYNGENSCNLESMLTLCSDSFELYKFLYDSYSESESNKGISKLILGSAKIHDFLDTYLHYTIDSRVKTPISEYSYIPNTNIESLDRFYHLAMALGIVELDGKDVPNLFFQSNGFCSSSNANANKYTWSNLKPEYQLNALVSYLDADCRYIAFETKDSAVFIGSVSVRYDTVDNLFPNLKEVIKNDVTRKITNLTKMNDNEYIKSVFSRVDIAEYDDSYTIGEAIKYLENIKSTYPTDNDAIYHDISEAAYKLFQHVSIETRKNITDELLATNYDSTTASEAFERTIKELFEGYHFINTILTTIPNNGIGILQKNTAKVPNRFSDWITGNNGIGFFGEVSKKANIYQDLFLNICGIYPFTNGDNLIGINQDTLDCQEQLNIIALKLLSYDNCGSDHLNGEKIDDTCWNEIIGDYNVAGSLFFIYFSYTPATLKADLMHKYTENPADIEIYKHDL